MPTVHRDGQIPHCRSPFPLSCLVSFVAPFGTSDSELFVRFISNRLHNLVQFIYTRHCIGTERRIHHRPVQYRVYGSVCSTAFISMALYFSNSPDCNFCGGKNGSFCYCTVVRENQSYFVLCTCSLLVLSFFLCYDIVNDFWKGPLFHRLRLSDWILLIVIITVRTQIESSHLFITFERNETKTG